MYVGNYDFWYDYTQLAQRQMREQNKKTEAKMKELLHVPEDRRIFIMLAVGYPSGTARTKVRKELNAIHSFNSYEA
jgi:hypothetical protein